MLCLNKNQACFQTSVGFVINAKNLASKTYVKVKGSFNFDWKYITPSSGHFNLLADSDKA